MGFGETVFPFQMIFASGKYINGISYSSAIFLQRMSKETIPLRDGTARRRLHSIFDRML
jgi:hypothetical protein